MKEYDSNIHIFVFSDLRKVDYILNSINPEEKTNGLTNLYIDGKSADYVHDVLPSEENAIDFIQQNEKTIYNNLITALKKKFNYEANHLGLYSIKLLDQTKDDFAYVEFSFLNINKELVGVVMYKEKIMQFI